MGCLELFQTLITLVRFDTDRTNFTILALLYIVQGVFVDKWLCHLCLTCGQLSLRHISLPESRI